MPDDKVNAYTFDSEQDFSGANLPPPAPPWGDDDDRNDGVRECDQILTEAIQTDICPDAGESTVKSDAQTSCGHFPQNSEPTEISDENAESVRIRSESLKILGKVGNFGLFLLIAIIFGYFIGYHLDSFLGTKPVFTVFWIVCAVIASFRELWRSVREAKRIGDGDDDIKREDR